MNLTVGFGQLFGSGYVRAVVALSSGQVIAMAIPILAAPVLGRLYLPIDYGILATYMAFAQVLSVVSTLQFQQAIFSEQSERRAVELVWICRWASRLVALIAVILVALLIAAMANSLNYSDARWWLLLLPISTLAAGSTAAITALATRRQFYRVLARVPVVTVLTTVSVSIILGTLGWGTHGLFASYFLGQAISFALLVRLFNSMEPVRDHPKLIRLVALARRHRKFPIYTLPSELLNNLNLQMPVFALIALGAAPLLGAFTRARQLVAMPLTLLGGTIGQVFRQRASQHYRIEGNCRRIYLKTLFMLVAIGLLPTILLIAFAPELFRIFLGPNWTESGEIARILAPMLLLRLISSPLSSVFQFTGGQRLSFQLSVAAFTISATLNWAPAIYWESPELVIYGFAIAFSIIYSIYLILGFRQVSN